MLSTNIVVSPEMEYTNFSLTYDGIYHIHLSTGRIIHVFLELDVILKMLEIEGYTNEEVFSIYKNEQPLEFKKMTLMHLGYVTHDDAIDSDTSELAEPLFINNKLVLMHLLFKNNR